MSAELCLVTAADKRSYPIVEGHHVIGRTPQCDVHVSDPSVSRVHAAIVLKGEKLTVSDLESTNGTFVDGVRVTRSALKLGQELRVGALVFQLLSKIDALRVLAADDDETPRAATKEGLDRTRADLSSRERQVLGLLLQGLQEKQIATALELSSYTVHNVVRVLYRVFGVHSRSELMALLGPGATADAEAAPHPSDGRPKRPARQNR